MSSTGAPPRPDRRRKETRRGEGHFLQKQGEEFRRNSSLLLRTEHSTRAVGANRSDLYLERGVSLTPSVSAGSVLRVRLSSLILRRSNQGSLLPRTGVVGERTSVSPRRKWEQKVGVRGERAPSTRDTGVVCRDPPKPKQDRCPDSWVPVKM